VSYQVEVVIACDDKDCSAQYIRRRINEGGLSKTFAGNMAAENGWWIPGGKTSRADPKKAYCPKHHPEENR
jgi:hypothetical protein